MYVYRRYGQNVEITSIEKLPQKVRVSFTKKRDGVYAERRQDNIRRSRRICMRRLSSALATFGVPLLLTLTFEGISSDASYASDSLRDFQVRLRREFGRGCQSLFVPELSPRGRIHFHGLVFGLPLYWGDKRQGGRTVSYGEERSTRLLARLWGQGYVDCRQTDGHRRLAFYLSKYLTKSSEQVLFNGLRMVRVSHGFPKEVEVDIL